MNESGARLPEATAVSVLRSDVIEEVRSCFDADDVCSTFEECGTAILDSHCIDF